MYFFKNSMNILIFAVFFVFALANLEYLMCHLFNLDKKLIDVAKKTHSKIPKKIIFEYKKSIWNSSKINKKNFQS